MTEDLYKLPRRGKMVVIEGIDCSGKQTQAKLLHMKILQSIGAVLFDFPNYTNVTGQFIKNMVRGTIDYNSYTWACLMAANRYEDRDLLLNSLRQTNVVCNRYKESNLVYSTTSGINSQWLFSLDEAMPDADLVIILNISGPVSYDRKKHRDVIESDISYLEDVRSNYLKMAPEFGWRIVNGTDSVDVVHKNICEIVNKKFNWNLSYD